MAFLSHLRFYGAVSFSALGQLVLIVTVAAELRQASYSITDGKCSADAPYTVKNCTKSKCGLECLHLVKCSDFNHKIAVNECALFLHKPLFYDFIPGCDGFKASQLINSRILIVA